MHNNKLNETTGVELIKLKIELIKGDNGKNTYSILK